MKIKEKFEKLKGKWKDMPEDEKKFYISSFYGYGVGLLTGFVCHKIVTADKLNKVAHKAFVVGANAADCTYAKIGGRPKYVIVKDVITDKAGNVIASKIDIADVGKQFLTFAYRSDGGVDVLFNDSQ